MSQKVVGTNSRVLTANMIRAVAPVDEAAAVRMVEDSLAIGISQDGLLCLQNRSKNSLFASLVPPEVGEIPLKMLKDYLCAGDPSQSGNVVSGGTQECSRLAA